MPFESSAGRLLLSLVHLRSHALAAMDLSAGAIASGADIEMLENLAQRAVGVSLRHVACIPDDGETISIRETVDALAALLPPAEAEAASHFLMTLAMRVQEWLAPDVP